MNLWSENRNGRPLVRESREPLSFSVNREVFVSREILEREQRAVFDRCWIYVGHASELRGPGDFKTRSEQSARTAARLNLIDQALAQERLDFARLADRVQKTSDIMMADLEEWQTVFRTRPLSLPA